MLPERVSILLRRLARQLLLRSGAESAESSPPSHDNLVTRLKAPPATLPAGHGVCLFDGERLAGLWKTPEDTTDIPAGHLAFLVDLSEVAIRLPFACGSVDAEVSATVRLEPELGLGRLAAIAPVRRADVESLFSSIWSGLLRSAPELLPESMAVGPEDGETLRARTSLLLQQHGLRCISLDVRALQAPSSAELLATSPPESLGACETEELERAVEAVKAPQDWDELVQEMEATRLARTEQWLAAGDLGRRYLEGQVSSREAAQRIRDLCAEQRERGGIARPDLQRWSGLAIRLRLMPDGGEAAGGRSETLAGSSNATEAALASKPGGKRPSIFFTLTQQGADRRLRQHVRQSVASSLETVQRLASSIERAAELVDVRGIAQRLQLVRDLLDTMPDLRAGPRQLRPNWRSGEQLLHALEEAATKADLLSASVSSLARATDAASRSRAVAEAVRAADQLEEFVRERRGR